MPVKELIGLFESNAPRAGHISQVRTNQLEIEDPHPPPRLARFLNHPRPQNDAPVQYDHNESRLDSDTTVTNNRTPLHDHTDAFEESSEVTLDVTEEAHNYLNKNLASSSTLNITTDRQLPSSEIREEIEEEHLLKEIHRYPPNTPTTLRKSYVSFTPTSVRRSRIRSPHRPVPAVTLFARKAGPLYLPKLDDYLASLKPPKFTRLEGTVTGKGKENDPPMFPPMERLAASKQSIEELEENSLFPAWRNRGTIFGAIVTVILGLTGSSVLATYYSLQGLFNTVQVFALLLSTIVPVGQKNIDGKWRDLLLGKIPNILALNFASTLGQSLLYLIIFMGIAAILLYHFYHSTSDCHRYRSTEGLLEPEPKGANWGILIVSFLLTVIYLPLSTLAIHVLVWSQDLWVVPNPYINATSNPPVVPPLGPPEAFRDPLDFCWTTTMAKDRINFAPIVIILSVVVLSTLTIWFPIRFRRVMQQSAPRVDPYTELGQPRSSSDMDREYQRLLYRDRNPFSFLYIGFRRNNGSYQSTYLFAKLSTLFIVAVIDADNCLFRSLSRPRLAIARQVLLLISTLIFFGLHCYFVPFIDPVSNASEWISRLNYIATAIVALAIALDMPGKDIINGPVLYTIYAITYGLTFYFLIINTSVMHRVVKRIARRIDFSLDVFSPRLDTSLSSLHIRRRIWQESITTLLLISPECRIPKKQRMIYAQARDSEYPPYLLYFEGMPGERHVENLKILRDIGTPSYKKAVALVYGPDRAWFKHIESEIQKHFVGPDCFWKNPSQAALPGYTNFFGNAWWIPFPPTLVIKYDNGTLTVLKDVVEFEGYIAQNSSPGIRRRREIRMAIRALDGQTVIWPFDHIRTIGASSLWSYRKRRYKADTVVHYETCVLHIKHRGHLPWEDMQLGSGFDIELVYGKDVRVNSTTIGLDDDIDLTPSLARFLFLNQELITERLEHIQVILTDYRVHHWKEARVKNRVLTYKFLSFVYDQPQSPTSLAESAMDSERDLRVRQLITANETVFEIAYERLIHVSTSQAMRWWYIFWDDLWRRNNSTIAALRRHATDFNPHYPTSIAYTPLPRPALEAFLIQRGLLSKIPKWGDFFHTGFLNKLYLRLNDAVFGGSSQGILFHIGEGDSERDMLGVDLETQARSSTMGTGGGTDYDQSSIQARPTYKWEGLFEDPIRKGKGRRKRWFAKMGAWFGITPLWNSGMLTQGLAADVRLENGRYVLIGDRDLDVPRTPRTVDPFRDKS